MDNTFVIRSAAVSDRGLSEKRPQNEDSYLEIDQKGIFAVADGVGGANAGEVASQMAVEILGEAFTNFPKGADVELVMRSALEQANSAIHQMSNDLSQLSKMATTVVALHVNGNIATIGHVGDSRLYRLDPEGTLYRETDDHSMVAEEVRAGRMTEEQAENHPSKNIISRALGAEPTVEVDLKTMMVEPNTRFLLCSDGVTRHIGDLELADLLSSNEDAATLCDHIKAICYQRGAEDNLTAVIVEVGAAAAATYAPAAAAENGDVLSLDDDDERTVTAKRYNQHDADEPNGDDDLLELETKEIEMPTAVENEIVGELDRSEFYDDPSVHETVPFTTSETAEVKKPLVQAEDLQAQARSEYYDNPSLHETVPFTPTDTAEVEMPLVPAEETEKQEEPEEPAAAAPVIARTQAEAANDDNFAMFGHKSGVGADDRIEGASTLGNIAAYLGMLIAGALIGLGFYHFFLKPAPVATTPPIEEMRSRNIPLSAFEENRRDVDKDPAGYLTKNTQPQDCEDFYLVGRAYLLSGDYPKAKVAFAEARKRIAEADPSNAKVIESDIAMAMAVTNDTTIQNILKKELEPVKAATPR